ncbi:MAG TPA: protein kinase, partial [Blastocatellia bacterium]
PAYEEAASLFGDNPIRPAVGSRIEHYQIISLLGAGGMGEVYLAQDTRLSRKVALKILPAYFTKSGQRLRRFHQEARAASALNHPNIITIYEIGETKGMHFIATEFIEGETLRDCLTGEPMKIIEVLDVAEQVASALSAAHEAGIIHRDIKPENIMRRRDGIVKVLDFGLAKIIDQKADDAEATGRVMVKTASGAVMGTVPYMSPEQSLGRDLDHRSDIFSLGVVLYEMATGRSPFSGSIASETLDRILHAQPEAMARFNSNAPAELERVVRKCLEKDRKHRYQSARELLIDLRNLRREDDSIAQRSEKQNAFLISLWQRFPSLAIVIISALILAVVFAYRIWNPERPGAERSIGSESDISASTQPSRAEVMRYYLEIESSVGESARATGLDPLAVGQTFKFHFIPYQDGFLYIIAPEKKNALTTFLTNQPISDSGVMTNRVEAGADYSFPSGKDNWIEIGREGKLTTFTVIFSPQPLATPVFLAARAGHALTAGELQEFESLRRQFGATALESSVETGNHQPDVALTLLRKPDESGPLLFDIPIQSR